MKVMLDGQGADEVLGGYDHYFPLIAVALLRAAASPATRASRARTGASAGGRRSAARHALATLAPPARQATRRRARPVEPPSARCSPTELRDRLALRRTTARREFDSVHDLLAASTSSLGLPALLRYEDRNSMAHSIEARVPFLDHRLVEFAFRLPDDYKIHGAATKDDPAPGHGGTCCPGRSWRAATRSASAPSPPRPGAWPSAHRESLLADRTRVRAATGSTARGHAPAPRRS